MKSILALVVAFALAFVGSSNAGLINYGNGMIYDTVLNVTWLQDANYAMTSGYDADGQMTWDQANVWAAGLNYGGYTDWRLPKTLPINGTNYIYNLSHIGASDIGENVSAPNSQYSGSIGSEMAYMYYNNLGNIGEYDINGDYRPSGWGLQNTGLFLNLQASSYWSETEYAPVESDAWFFQYNFGYQSMLAKWAHEPGGYAWAVRDGAPTTPVPLPNAALLFGSGLVMVWGRIAWDRRRRINRNQ